MPKICARRGPDKHCKHCKAPAKSVFEGPPLQKKLEEKNYVLETNQYNIKHIYDQEKKELPKELKPKQVTKDWLKTMSMVSRISENPLVHNWSGYTFMTEHENQRIERSYQELKLDSKVDRVVWRSFHKRMKQKQSEEKMFIAGPDWFQEMSPLQMELVDHLEPLLQSDLKESHSGRAQEFLYNLGIWPEIPPKAVAKAVKSSRGNVISFLFRIHQELVNIETPDYENRFYEAKKMKKNISPFSINERILLTSVFHYHFPTLLKKLDQLLPPPYQEPPVLWGKKPIRKKKKYSSPYLEPQPINDRPWYEDRAEEELERKVIRKMKRDKEKKERDELMMKMKMQEDKLKQKQEVLRGQGAPVGRTSVEKQERVKPGSLNLSIFDEEDIANLAVLPPRERKSFFFKKYTEKISSYLDAHGDDVMDETMSEECTLEVTSAIQYRVPSDTVLRDRGNFQFTNTPPSSALTMESALKAIAAHQLKPEGSASEPPSSEVVTSSAQFIKKYQPGKEYPGIFGEDEAQKQQLTLANTTLLSGLFGAGSDTYYITRCLLDTEVENISEDIHLIKVPSLISPRSSSEETVEESKPKSLWVPLDITLKELTSVTRISSHAMMEKQIPYYQLRRMSGPPLPDLTVLKTVRKVSKRIAKKNKSLMEKPYVVECTEPECALIQNLDQPLSEFEFAKHRIMTMPPKKQLSAALRFLCDKGDPLAVLPNMENVPWLVRWFDKRRGIKRTLTKADKEELMGKSQNIWNAEYTNTTAAPLIEIPENSYPWSHKNWLMNLINERVHKHQRTIKHIMIDNARDLFPSMFCEYFDTPLNKSFRKTFYAYFPARERDCLVVKPWNPVENRDDKPKLTDK